jgi:precorrin-2 dehydrogenase/sirohydrochlorin ferrochelatase
MDQEGQKYYPVNLDVRNRDCLVVGGGAVGARKVSTLLDCGARVTVVSPETVAEVDRLAESGALILEKRPFSPSDLDGRFLVIGATDDEPLNRQIRGEAEKRQMLCNIADFPEGCNFILPAVVRRGDLIIAISTSGNSPAFAKRLRKQIEREFGPEYGLFLRLMGAIRGRLLLQEHAPEAHKPLFEALIDGGLLEKIRQGDPEPVDQLLAKVLGSGFRYRELIDDADSESG